MYGSRELESPMAKCRHGGKSRKLRAHLLNHTYENRECTGNGMRL